MASVVVIGGGGHAKVLICVLKKSGYLPVGYTDPHDRGLLLGVPCLGNDTVLPALHRKDPRCQAAMGIGKIDSLERRLRLLEEVEGLSFSFPAVVSCHAVVNEGSVLAAGAQVFDGVVVNSGAQVGRGCILNTNCTVEHDCRIGDDVHIAPGATLCGGVAVGDHSFIGAGATVSHSVAICERCIVGAGSVVVRDLTVPGTYVGIPAKRVR